MPNPKLPGLVLSEDEAETLRRWSRRPKTAQALAMRSRIVLRCARGGSNTEVAEELGVERGTVAKWRSRFVADRLDGLLDEPRPGRPRTITDEQVEAVITKTLETTPKNATHWSTRSMAAELGLTQSAVSRIWRAFGLQPHRQDKWKLSKDPQFVDKVKDVVGLYLAPPERAVVLCVDEKSQIQALDRTAPILPMLPGVPQRATHDYKRHGTSSLYAALDITTGQVIGSLHARHRAIEFKKFLTTIDREAPRAPRRTPGHGQRLDPQDPSHPTLAGRPPEVRRALHPDLELLAQPGRALVLRAHHQEAPTRRTHQRPSPQHRYPSLDQHLERKPQTLRVDQDRRPDPRIDRALLHANQ
jgi:transposase